MGEGELWYAGKFDTARFDAAMSAMGITRPVIDEGVIQALVKRAVADGYMPGPPGGPGAYVNGSYGA